MAEQHPSGPLEMGAEMDYAEHEKTYNFFLEFTKYATLIVVALLVAMAFGFFTSAGFISSFILFVLICGIGAFSLR
ncbi:aa3-type cytochrome c oxidase subunit IV [Aliihoeflea sp. PC F10.4]